MIDYRVSKQQKGYCGPASLKIIFDYCGIEKSQREWAKLSSATHEDGVQNDGLMKAIRSVGFSGKIIRETTFNEVRKLITSKKTIIVIWWSGGGGHYSPVVDISKKTITLADPELGRHRRIGLKKFDHLWFDFSKDNNRQPSDLELRALILIDR